MRERLAAGAAIFGAALLVLGLQAAHAQEAAAVDVRDNEFVEAEITITAGETVEWSQSGMNPHSVTADDGSFDSHPNCLPDCMGQGDTFSQTFETAGDHRYYCKIHGGPDGQGMSGIVRVEAGSQPEPTSTAAPVTSTTEPTAEASTTTTTAAVGGDDGAAPPTAEAAPQTLPNTGPPSPVLLVVGAVLLVGGAIVQRLGTPR